MRKNVKTHKHGNWLVRILAAFAFIFLGASAEGATTLTTAKVILRDAPSNEATTIRLPYLWDRSHPGKSGVAEFVFDFEIVSLEAEPYGLYAAKIANGYEVILNGKLIERFGTFQWPAQQDSKLPRIIPIGPALQAGHNELRVVLRGDAGRQGGLSPLMLGTMAEVQQAHLNVWFWRSPARLAVAIFSAIVGIMGLSLWLTQWRPTADFVRRRDPLYLYMGLAELCWVFRVTDSIIETPPLPLAWWSVLSSLALGGWACLTTLFCMELIGWPWERWPRLLRGWMSALFIGGFFAAAAAWIYVWPIALTLWYSALGLTFLLFSMVFAWISVVRRKDYASSIFALAIVVNVIVGLVDLYLLRLQPSIVGSSALYFSSVLFGLAASVVVLLRFRAATVKAADLQANMAFQVAQKEQELKQTYAQMADLEKRQARISERSLILREMHDGVGMHLSTAMRQLQSGKATDQEVLHTLGESLDQLKLSIDAMNLPRGDVTALLANLRYRLEPRLRASDIDLQWNVDLIEPIERLDDKAMRQLQFIVYEALSNVMQHAQAISVCIEAARTENGVRLRIIDNGRGFDTSQPWRKGLMSMRDRAAGIGGTLVLQSSPGHTMVEILIA